MTSPRSTETLDYERPREITTLRPGRILLRIEAPDHKWQVKVERTRVTIGAHEDCAIVIEDPAVSATHCELHLGEQGSILRDCGSKNGTWYNDASIREVWVGVGQSFKVGNSVVYVAEISDVEVPISTEDHFGQVHGVGPVMGELFAKLERIAETDLDVLCTGEPGTGKGLIARSIHEKSSRSGGPFVAVDCTSLGAAEAAAELFGDGDQRDALDRADGGTLFIDGITALSIRSQERLLRRLKARDVRRSEDGPSRSPDTRVISSTSQDLIAMLADGTFMHDLLYHVASIRVEVPALRHRDDGNVTMLAEMFLERMAEEVGRELSFDRGVHSLLVDHEWPGNVWELFNTIRAAAFMVAGDTIRRRDICLIGEQRPRMLEYAEVAMPVHKVKELFTQSWDRARRQFGRLYATHVMTINGGSVLRAAFQAGVHRNTITRLLREDE